MTLRSLADTLAVDPQRSARDRAAIAAAWGALAEALDAGECTDGQFSWLMDREPPGDADALVVNLWARTLRRAAADPRGISADPDSLKTYRCRCGPGVKGRDTNGWVFETKISAVSGLEVTYAVPCQDCNPRQRLLWAQHWIEGGDHRCAECMPRGGKTPTPLTGDRDAGAAERQAEKEAAADAILFGTDGLA